MWVQATVSNKTGNKELQACNAAFENEISDTCDHHVILYSGQAWKKANYSFMAKLRDSGAADSFDR